MKRGNNKKFVLDEKFALELIEMMASSGEIFCLCYRCKIPLNEDERKKEACNNCGQLNADELLYVLNKSEKC